MRYVKASGLSFIELLVTLVILAIIGLLTYPVPVVLDNYRTRTQAHSITSLLRTGANIALSTGNEAILCPSSDGRNCLNTWNTDRWMLFINSNSSTTRSNDEPLVLQHQPDTHTLIRFQNLQSPRFLRWYPGGQINRAFSLIVCPRNRSDSEAQVLIVNLQGRVRPGSDQNNDGIAELANGSNASCRQ